MSSTQTKQKLPPLMLGAIGVVYGDIGTSPLYAIQATFSGTHPLPVMEANIFGVLSVLFWTIMLLVSFKYVALILRADNHGEGGSLALLALVSEPVSYTHLRAHETASYLVCRLLLENKKQPISPTTSPSR